MSLLVDVGNSRIKWANSNNLTIDNHGSFTLKQLSLGESLDSHWQQIKNPKHVWISNVAGKDIAHTLSDFIKHKWGINPVFAKVQRERSGVVNGYEDANQLGIDRWLAIVAAWNKYHAPTCIVDCGTAITIDGISQSGRHIGGLIIPGIDLLLNTLNTATDGINTEAVYTPKLEFGFSTSVCTVNGAGFAVVSLIDKVVEKMQSEQANEICCVITGGYAEKINYLLAHKFNEEPHLVLHGLCSLKNHVI